MKKSDILVSILVLLFFAPFIIFRPVFEYYEKFNHAHAYIMSFIKFGILATFGEMIALRIKNGIYYKKGFGLFPRIVVWGFLGIVINMAFNIFASGSPFLLRSLGINVADGILKQGFSEMKLLTAFTVSTTMNLFFAPVFMTFHKITDEHISRNKGKIKCFYTPIRFAEIFPSLNWYVMWNFVFKKTIPLFWIPAHTITFLLPAEYRILVAAVYSVILGVFLAFASLKS